MGGPHEQLNLQEIARRTGVPVQKLRYVDNKPMLERQRKLFATGKHGRGVARAYTRRQAYLLALITLLISGGLARRVVRRVLDRYYQLLAPEELKRKTSQSVVWEMTFDEQARDTILEIGDGRYMRVIAHKTKRPIRTFGWVSIEGGDEVPGAGGRYEPLLRVTVDLHRLREAIRNE